MKELSKKRKYPKTILSNHASLENDQYPLLRLSRKVNSDIGIFRLCSTHGKANNQTFRKIKTRISSKKR